MEAILTKYRGLELTCVIYTRLTAKLQRKGRIFWVLNIPLFAYECLVQYTEPHYYHCTQTTSYLQSSPFFSKIFGLSIKTPLYPSFSSVNVILYGYLLVISSNRQHHVRFHVAKTEWYVVKSCDKNPDKLLSNAALETKLHVIPSNIEVDSFPLVKNVRSGRSQVPSE